MFITRKHIKGSHDRGAWPWRCPLAFLRWRRRRLACCLPQAWCPGRPARRSPHHPCRWPPESTPSHLRPHLGVAAVCRRSSPSARRLFFVDWCAAHRHPL